MAIGLLALLLLILVLVAFVGLAKDLLHAAVALALASVGLSVVLFQQGAWLAAVFELSVCAGLITVLFVSTVSLTHDSDQKEESKVSLNLLPAFLLLFVGLDFYAVKWISTHLMTPALLDRTHDVRVAFWNTRATDILGQVSLILSGVFAILALFKRVRHGSKHE